MTTITTDQTVGLEGTTYTVWTDDGRMLGTYYQERGAQVITSDDLPAEDQGVVGPIEAIASIARDAGVRGFQLAEGDIDWTDELTAEVVERMEGRGGFRKTHMSDVGTWSYELGVNPTDVFGIMLAHDGERVAA